MNESTRIKNAALNFLSRREHARDELALKLKRHTSDESLIQQVIENLSQSDLQSDSRFAEMYVRSRYNRGYGVEKIRQELMQRKLPLEMIENALANYNENWLQLASFVRRKRFGATLPKTAIERAKQSRFLFYRGFSSEIIKACFDG